MRKYVLGFFALLLLIVLFTVGYESRKIDRGLVISRETTRVTGPVRKDGRIDYVAAVNESASDGVTTDENAMVLYAQAIGPEPGNMNLKYQGEFFRLLGIDRPDNDGAYFRPLDSFIRDHHFASLEKEKEAEGDNGAQNPQSLVSLQERMLKAGQWLEIASSRLWSADEFPLLAEWVEANEKPLILIVAGSKRPKYYAPLATSGDDPALMAVLLPNVQAMRNVAQALQARALLRARTGEVDAAWEDLEACHRMGRHVAQGETLVELLVGYAIDATAFATERTIANHIPQTAQQSREYQARIDRLPPFPSAVDRVDGAERMMFLDTVGLLSRDGAHMVRHFMGIHSESESMAEGLFTFAADNFVDWNQVLRTGNEWYDRLVEAGRKPTFIERDVAAKELVTELELYIAQARKPGQAFKAIFTGRSISSTATYHVTGVLISMFMPAVSGMFVAEERAHLQPSLSKLAVALAAYKTEHGKYPETLDKLEPEFIGSVPLDNFSGNALIYKPNSDGYVLYSVGGNLKDDGGLEPGGVGLQYCDDLSVRMPVKPIEQQTGLEPTVVDIEQSAAGSEQSAASTEQGVESSEQTPDNRGQNEEGASP